MPGPFALNEREQGELIAFLDNELGDAAARRVEARIQQDAHYRTEADAMKQVWDLLDHLPKAEPSQSFTNRTMSRLAGTPERQPAAPAPARRRHWAVGVAWAAALLLATYVGFAGFGGFAPRSTGSERELVRELRLIENKRLYELIDDLEFLQELDQPDLFGDEKVGRS